MSIHSKSKRKDGLCLDFDFNEAIWSDPGSTTSFRIIFRCSSATFLCFNARHVIIICNLSYCIEKISYQACGQLSINCNHPNSHSGTKSILSLNYVETTCVGEFHVTMSFRVCQVDEKAQERMIAHKPGITGNTSPVNLSDSETWMDRFVHFH